MVLDDVFRQQHGVISRAQVLAAGLSSAAIGRRLDSGQWEAVHRGVYRHRAVPETWESRLLAAVFGTDGVASHRSAARLHGLDGFGAWRPEVTIANRRRRRPEGVIVHRSTQFSLRDEVVVASIPCTSVDRTILDLGAVLRLPLLERAAESALRMRSTTWPRLHEVLQQHSRRGRDGCGVLRALLEARYGDPVIPLSQWGREVAQRSAQSQLPPCEVEYRVTDEMGRLVLQVDLAFPRHRVAIELDSVTHHLDRSSWERDRRVRNELRRLGWVVIEITWREWTARPQNVIQMVADTLRIRSVVAESRSAG